MASNLLTLAGELAFMTAALGPGMRLMASGWHWAGAALCAVLVIASLAIIGGYYPPPENKDDDQEIVS